MPQTDADVGKMLCLITAPTNKATSIARSILEQKLVACINIVPLVKSLYWWEDKVSEEDESLLILKTTSKAIDPLNEAVKAIHPYETFELIGMDITNGNSAYLDWIASCVVPKYSIEDSSLPNEIN